MFFIPTSKRAHLFFLLSLSLNFMIITLFLFIAKKVKTPLWVGKGLPSSAFDVISFLFIKIH